MRRLRAFLARFRERPFGERDLWLEQELGLPYKPLGRTVPPIDETNLCWNCDCDRPKQHKGEAGVL